MSELGEVVSSIPPVTRTIILTAVIMAGLNAFGLIPYTEYMCLFDLVWGKFQLYRLFTGFLIPNPQPMQGLMELYMLYTFSKGLETGKFKKRTPDYLYYLLIIIPLMIVGAYFFLPPLPSLSPALLSALTFTWSIANYSQQVNFYFMPIKASLLPAVSLGFRLLADGQLSFLLSLIGGAAAYIYNCIETRSLGPLMSVLTSKEPQPANSSSSRLGTVNNFNEWYYSTGQLPAPQWLNSAVGTITGVDYNRPAGGIPPAQKGHKVGTGSSSTSSTTSSASQAAGVLRARFGHPAPTKQKEVNFRGKGRRLGSLDDGN